MQTIRVKISDKSNTEFVIELLKKFPFVKEIITMDKPEGAEQFFSREETPSVDDFAGLWSDNPRSLEEIRAKTWKRDL